MKMLLQFRFKNYKSFRDDTILDMTATKITELNKHVRSCGNEKVLPLACIFGANASGKSNVVKAFRYMQTYVVSSFGYGDEAGKKGKVEFSAPTPFLFDTNSAQAASTFEVYFISSAEDGLKTYNYGFSVDKNGVCEEWLNYRARTARGDYRRVFYRNGDTIDLCGIDEKSRENIRVALAQEALIVSLGAKLMIPKLKLVRDWFLDGEVADFGKPMENCFLSEQLPEGFAEDKEIQSKVASYFASFDPSIIGFDVEVLETDESTGSKKVRIDAIHKLTNGTGTATIPLKMESAGTLKMFALYPLLQSVLESGGVLFIDELNARLHPLLVRVFVMTFYTAEKNPKNAQLVFTTHDAWQLNSNTLRRDEVWFTEKSEEGLSTLYSLADFSEPDGMKIRKDENYEKNYLLGKYGGIPLMKSIDLLGGNTDA